MNTNRLSLLVLGSIITAIHLAGFVLVADGAQEVFAQSVSYHDLDLSEPAQAAVLYDRIERAAAQVCDTFGAGQASSRKLQKKCVDRAIAASVARVNDPNLTARHDAGSRLHIAARSGDIAL